MKKRIYLSLTLVAMTLTASAQALLVEKSSGDKLELPVENIAEMRFKTNSEVYPDQTPECVEIIDLGMSVNWASVNLGASLPEQSGYLIAWGELEEKDWYSWSGYKHGSSSSTLTKYCLTDGIRVLQSEDDAATMLWGGEWRMPSREEWQELIDNCDIDYNAEENGYPGVRLTSKVPGYEDKSIFLCAAGWIQDEYHIQDGALSSYWSNECAVFPNGDFNMPEFAFAAEFWREGEYAEKYYYSGVYRWQGRPIRAVQSKEAKEVNTLVSFVVEFIDGSIQKYASTEQPKISFEENSVVIKQELMETRFEQDKITRFYFDMVDVSIANNVQDEIIFYYDGNNIIVNGKSCMLSIFDINGQVFYNVPTQDGYNTIDVSGYNPGIYIVKANNQSIKILKK